MMENENFLQMWKDIKELFERVFKKHDQLWIERERKINTKFMVLFIIRLVIPKDERGYSNTLLEIFNNFLNGNIKNMPTSLAASSICEARMKLDPEIFKELNNGIVEIWNDYNKKPALWHGHKLYGVDGSKILLPRELLKFGFKTEGEHVHYPHGLLSSVYDLLTGIPQDYSFVSHGDERACAINHLEHTEEGSIHMYDRGYFSFELLSAHREVKKNAIFRLQTKTRIKVIDDFWESNETDIEVLVPPTEKIISKVKKNICKANLEPIRVRLIKYVINEKAYMLLTTLLDKGKYTENCLKEVYHIRWEHEELLKVSKVITGVTDIHSRSERGVKQELFAHFLIITLLKIIESQAHHEMKKEIENKPPPPRRLRRIDNNDKDKGKLQKCNSKNWPDLRNEIQVNQKTVFLLISWILEKLICWEPIKFIEKTVGYILGSAKKVYQCFRPDRMYPRRSKTPPILRTVRLANF